MADTLYTINSGFYNAVDNDRTYDADDMSKPYHRIVANGVFATPQGTPSTDFQVLAGDGMQITVKAGEAILGDKWVQSPADQVITVQSNPNYYLRVDSIVLRVDKRLSGRKASIVYRTGVPSQTPDASAPSINLYADVPEFRLANIYVYTNVDTITQAEISDTRGSAECPWVTSVVDQPDTSTLWNRYDAAFSAKLNAMGVSFDAYLARVEQAWDQFFDDLTQELTLATNIMTLTSSFTTSGTTTTIPINIASYDPSTDVLTVFINGLNAQGMYTVSGGDIILANAVPNGTKVNFLVFKGIITADMSTVPQMIQRIEDIVTAAISDSGWEELTLQNGTPYKAVTTPVFRRVGNVVYIEGSIKGVTTANTVIGLLPVSLQPTKEHLYASIPYDPSDGTAGDPVMLYINTSGQLVLIAGSADADYKLPLSTSFILG